MNPRSYESQDVLRFADIQAGHPHELQIAAHQQNLAVREAVQAPQTIRLALLSCTRSC
jgi:hypothetical protein